MLKAAFLLLAGSCAIAASAAVAAPGSSIANGRALYQTGRDLAGNQMSASPRPLHATCAACHRSNGAGGVHLPGGAVSADLRHASLVKMKYTPALVARAISTGLDSDGKPLDRVMPRWQLTQQDLHDVAYYVWTQLK